MAVIHQLGDAPRRALGPRREPRPLTEERSTCALTAAPDAPAHGRAWLRADLGSDLDEGERDRALLLLSELITNAVRHADAREDGQVAVEGWRYDRRLRVEVRDGGSGHSQPAVAVHPDARGGFGLMLVECLSDDWGWTHSDGGTVVWFELATASQS